MVIYICVCQNIKLYTLNIRNFYLSIIPQESRVKKEKSHLLRYQISVNWDMCASVQGSGKSDIVFDFTEPTVQSKARSFQQNTQPRAPTAGAGLPASTPRRKKPARQTKRGSRERGRRVPRALRRRRAGAVRLPTGLTVGANAGGSTDQ